MEVFLYVIMLHNKLTHVYMFAIIEKMKGGSFMFTYILYFIAIAGLILSFVKNREKTKKALKKAFFSFENILPQFLAIIIFIGIILSVMDEQFITKLIGAESGIGGVITTAIVGAITLIPGFVAFPLASSLLENGAGIMQIAAFVSTLMMVGVVTIPMEKKIFASKVTILRNTFAFIFSFIVAFIMGGVLGV